MAYVKKANRKPETAIPNNTGLEDALNLFDGDELEYVNMLASICPVIITPDSKRCTVGNFQGLYEFGFNDVNPIVAKLRSQQLDFSQWEIAERLIVAHGYVLVFGLIK